MRVRGSHEIQCCGSRVSISEKGVKVLTAPCVTHCALHESLYGVSCIDSRSVAKSIRRKIADSHFCCANRCFNSDSLVAYGASEMMSRWISQKLIECAVIVCEGAGTIITADPNLVQGIGARLTGIVKTSPITEIIDHIERGGGIVLDKTHANIDQYEGVKKACKMGYRRLAVTVAGFQAEEINRIRELETHRQGDILVFSVCNTSTKESDVKYLRQADVVCASASKVVREQIGPNALMQVGITIPVFVLTSKGRIFVHAYLADFQEKLVVFRSKNLPHLITGKTPELAPSNVDRKA